VDVYTPSTVRAYATHIRRVYPMVGQCGGDIERQDLQTPRTG
jgi:hypothetical protein